MGLSMSKLRDNYTFVMGAPEVEAEVSPAVMKVRLRRELVGKLVGKGELSVLAAYYKSGELWSTVSVGLSQQINVVGVVEKRIPGAVHLVGSNVRYVKSLDLTDYDIVDVDAPGSPYAVLRALFMNNSFSEMGVFFTFNKVLNGGLDRKMLLDLGFTPGMLKAVRPMLQARVFELFKGWLGRMGVSSLTYYALKYSWGRVYLGFFKISRQKA